MLADKFITGLQRALLRTSNSAHALAVALAGASGHAQLKLAPTRLLAGKRQVRLCPHGHGLPAQLAQAQDVLCNITGRTLQEYGQRMHSGFARQGGGKAAGTLSTATPLPPALRWTAIFCMKQQFEVRTPSSLPAC